MQSEPVSLLSEAVARGADVAELSKLAKSGDSQQLFQKLKDLGFATLGQRKRMQQELLGQLPDHLAAAAAAPEPAPRKREDPSVIVPKKVMPAGADPAKWNAQEKIGKCMWNAAKTGKMDELALMLRAPGVDVDWQNEHGETCFFIACNDNQLAVAQALLRAGATVDKPNMMGSTPLMAAAYWGNADTTLLCLSHGADPTLTYHDKTPLEVAKNADRKRIVAILQDATDGKGERFFPPEPPPPPGITSEMSEELQAWCREQMLEMSANDDLTLCHFLYQFERDDDVEGYVVMYLGETGRTLQFAYDFKSRRQHEVKTRKRQARRTAFDKFKAEEQAREREAAQRRQTLADFEWVAADGAAADGAAADGAAVGEPTETGAAEPGSSSAEAPPVEGAAAVEGAAPAAVGAEWLTLTFEEATLGLALGQAKDGRVEVRGVGPGSAGEKHGVRRGFVLHKVNGLSTYHEGLQRVMKLIQKGVRPIEMEFEACTLAASSAADRGGADVESDSD